MRKLLAITLSFFLFLFSTGLVINLHYCHDALVDVSWFSEDASCCCSSASSGEAELAAECCDNDTIQLAKTDRFAPSTVAQASWIAVEAPKSTTAPRSALVLPVPILDFTHFSETDLPPEDRVTRFQQWILYA